MRRPAQPAPASSTRALAGLALVALLPAAALPDSAHGAGDHRAAHGADHRADHRAARAPSFAGIVTRVVDGDTLWVRSTDLTLDGLPPGSSRKVRLHGLDAPERCQAWGPQASRALAGQVLGRAVRIEGLGHDDHGRLLARVWHDGADVGVALVQAGHAWSDGRGRRVGPYADSGRVGPYADSEADARAARRGLFADQRAQRPRDFRRQHGPCE